MSAVAPIGVFDSGLGGLSVLRELRTRLPAEDFVYVADSGHCPYGGKPASAVIARAEAITRFLIGQGARLIVVACNTATVVAAERLRARFPLPFVAMEPAVKPAATVTRSGVVGVLATRVTANGERLHRLIRDHAQGVQVLTQPCPGLVEQVESGDLDGPRTRTLIERYTAPLLAAGADTLVLGCTHYPFLRSSIAAVVGPRIVLIDTGAAVARRAASVLAERGRAGMDGRAGGERWFTSGEPERMQVVGSRLWGAPLTPQPLPAAGEVGEAGQ